MQKKKKKKKKKKKTLKRRPLKPTKARPLVLVQVIEYEREPGWGCTQREDERRWFRTEAAADRFVATHNANLGKKAVTPDLYYRAHKVGWRTA